MFRNIPTVTLNLLLLNITVYIVSLVLVQNGTPADQYLSAHYFNSVFFEPYQVVSHMFLHDLYGPGHIFFNMFMLVVFGGHLERVWGARRFFVFYIASGLGALFLYNIVGVIQLMEVKNALEAHRIDTGTLDVLIEQYRLFPTYTMSDFRTLLGQNIAMGSLEPSTLTYYQDVYDYTNLQFGSMAGASGALFGVMAAFGILFPNTELFLYFIPIPIKAKYLIGAYLLFEVYNSFAMPDDHIAHLAHVGGALVGIIIVLLRRRKDRTNFW